MATRRARHSAVERRRKEVAARHRLKELLTVKLQSEGQKHRLPHERTQRAVLTHRGLVKREVDALMKASDKKAIDQVLGKLDSARRVHRKDLLAIEDDLVKTAVSRLGSRVFGPKSARGHKDVHSEPRPSTARPLTARSLAEHSKTHRPEAPLSGPKSARGHKDAHSEPRPSTGRPSTARPLTARSLAEHSKTHRSEAPLSARSYGSRSQSHLSSYSSIRSSRKYKSSRASSVSRGSTHRSEKPRGRTHAQVRGAGGSSTVSKVSSRSGAVTHRAHNDRISKVKLHQLDRALFSKISHRISGRNICIRGFRYFDRSKRNRIELDDFKECLVELGMGMSDREMWQLFKCYDLGRTGAITFDNFRRTLMHVGAQPGIATWSEEVAAPQRRAFQHGLGDGSRARGLLQQKAVQRGYDRFQLQKAFRRFAGDDTDEIDEESFARACRALGSNFSDQDLQELFRKLAGPSGNTVLIHDLVDEFYVPAQHK